MMSDLGPTVETLLLRALAWQQSRQPQPVHPSRAHIHDQRTRGERIADAVSASVGSWPFIIFQTVFIIVWIILNSVAFLRHWDPYPWILLNLCMSTQAMYTGPIVMLSQNRQASKDRARDDTEAAEVEQLTAMNQQQLEILHKQDAILAALHAKVAGEPEPPTPPAAAAKRPRRRKSATQEQAASDWLAVYGMTRAEFVEHEEARYDREHEASLLVPRVAHCTDRDDCDGETVTQCWLCGKSLCQEHIYGSRFRGIDRPLCCTCEKGT